MACSAILASPSGGAGAALAARNVNVVNKGSCRPALKPLKRAASRAGAGGGVWRVRRVACYTVPVTRTAAAEGCGGGGTAGPAGHPAGYPGRTRLSLILDQYSRLALPDGSTLPVIL